MDYDIVKKPLKGRRQEEEYYIKPVYGQTVQTNSITDNIVRATTLTDADVLAAISALTEQVVGALKEGNRVNIKGLGTFAVRLSTPKAHLMAEDKVAKQIKVRSVLFRPDKSLVQRLGGVRFTRTTDSITRRVMTDAREVRRQLRHHFADGAGSVSRSEVQEMANCSMPTACRLLRRLVADGYLERLGRHNAPHYHALPKLLNEQN